jgi:uncharacterized damage-inducible protein DinB
VIQKSTKPIMTHLSSACFQILGQLEDILEDILAEDLCQPSTALSGSTIGQHLRHTLEFFLCLESGFESGVINYDMRARDKRMEADKAVVISSINRIRDFVAANLQDKELNLEASYAGHSQDYFTIPTTYSRELAYNIEHAIHHMAIIKIGVKEITPYIKLSGHFGVAMSTVRYHETLAGEK